MHVHVSLADLLLQTHFRVATLEAVSDSKFVNRLGYLNRLFCPSVELPPFRFGGNYRSFQSNNRVTVR